MKCDLACPSGQRNEDGLASIVMLSRTSSIEYELLLLHSQCVCVDLAKGKPACHASAG